MDISILQNSKFLGQDYRFHKLVELISKMVRPYEQTFFTHLGVVEGGDSSIRLFSFEPLLDFVILPRPGGTYTITIMLMEFASSYARYPEDKEKDSVKGWEFREIEVEGKPVLTAEAVWIQPSS